MTFTGGWIRRTWSVSVFGSVAENMSELLIRFSDPCGCNRTFRGSQVNSSPSPHRLLSTGFLRHARCVTHPLTAGARALCAVRHHQATSTETPLRAKQMRDSPLASVVRIRQSNRNRTEPNCEHSGARWYVARFSRAPSLTAACHVNNKQVGC